MACMTHLLNLAKRKFNANILKLKIVKSINESLSSQTEKTLKFQTPLDLVRLAICFGFPSYVIYTRKHLHPQRNKQTLRNTSLSSFKMQFQSREFSYFLNCEKVSLEDYFSARAAEEEDDQLYDYS